MIYNSIGLDVTSYTRIINSKETKLSIDFSQLQKGIYFIKTNTTTNKVYKNSFVFIFIKAFFNKHTCINYTNTF